MGKCMSDEQFYHRCAEILGTTYDCEGFQYAYRTRWNNRTAGNGRFPDHGLIRLFGDQVQIALRYPVHVQRNVEGRQAALDLLQQIIDDARGTAA